MSSSPIIQDSKLLDAVTHVRVNEIKMLYLTQKMWHRHTIVRGKLSVDISNYLQRLRLRKENMMGSGIKAIEIQYNGYRFRSRLEARWAVFFDLIGLKYEYEIEGFEMDELRYLRDFYIPSLDRWFEIKGKPLTEMEFKKCEEFCFRKDNNNIKFSVLIGAPGAVKFDRFAGILEYVWE